MSKKNYNKLPLSFQDQVHLLESRGLTIDNPPKTLKYLQGISYYRLSAYFLPYQQIKDKFNEGVTFKQIIDTYTFDRGCKHPINQTASITIISCFGAIF